MAELLKKHNPMKTQVAQLGSGTKGIVGVLSKQADWQTAAPLNVEDAFFALHDLVDYQYF